MKNIWLLSFGVFCMSSVVLAFSDDYHSRELTTPNAALTDGNRSYPLSPHEIELFTQSLDLVKDSHCRHDLNETLWGIIQAKRWAVASKLNSKFF